jgi:hypothetical protein
MNTSYLFRQYFLGILAIFCLSALVFGSAHEASGGARDGFVPVIVSTTGNGLADPTIFIYAHERKNYDFEITRFEQAVDGNALKIDFAVPVKDDLGNATTANTMPELKFKVELFSIKDDTRKDPTTYLSGISQPVYDSTLDDGRYWHYVGHLTINLASDPNKATDYLLVGAVVTDSNDASMHWRTNYSDELAFCTDLTLPFSASGWCEIGSKTGFHALRHHSHVIRHHHRITRHHHRHKRHGRHARLARSRLYRRAPATAHGSSPKPGSALPGTKRKAQR